MKNTVLREAIQQILKVGLRKFTVEDIASELGVSKKTIYKHFSSKADIISAVVDYALEMEKDYTLKVMDMAASPIKKMEALLFFHTGEGVPAWVVDELRKYYPEEYKKRETLKHLKRNYFNQLFEEAIKTGEVRGDLKSGMVNLLVRQTMETILDGDFLENQDLTLSQAIEQMRKIVFYGIVARTEEENGC